LRHSSVYYIGAMLGAVVLSGTGAAEGLVQPERAPVEVGRSHNDILGCNNFSTMISGNVSESEALQGDVSEELARTDGALGGISVSFYRPNGQNWIREATVYTGADGHYEVCDVPYATYRIKFCHPDFVLEFWDNKSTFNDSNGVVISAVHKQAAGISAQLEGGDGPNDCP